MRLIKSTKEKKKFTVKKYRWSNCNEQCEQQIFTNDKAINVLKGCQQAGGGRVGVVVRALVFHQCGPGSISALGVIRGLSLLVPYSAMRGFPPGTPVFPSHQKPTFDLI